MKIYLASPYSHPSEEVRRSRFLAAVSSTEELMSRGDIVYSPIVHCHPIASLFELDFNWSYWKANDEAFIEWCDELTVLMLPDWQLSKGIAAECSIAHSLGKVVSYTQPSARSYNLLTSTKIATLLEGNQITR